jgi:hypothetical protein
MAVSARCRHVPWTDDASAAGALAAELAARDAELAATRDSLGLLRRDFRYNLTLLEARDAELASYDAATAAAAAAAAAAEEALRAARDVGARDAAAAAQAWEHAACANARADAADALRHAGAEAAASAHARLADTLRAQQRRFEDELAQQKRLSDLRFAAAEARPADASRRLEATEQMLIAAREAAAAAASRAEAAEARLCAVHCERSASQRALADATTELAAARASADSFTERAAAAERNTSAAQHTVRSLSAELDARASASSAAITAARDEARSLALLLAARDAELAAAKEQEFDLHQATHAVGVAPAVDTSHAASFDSLSAENVRLREQLDVAVAANTRLRAGVARMRAEMEAAAAPPAASGAAELHDAPMLSSVDAEIARLTRERDALMDISSALRSALCRALALSEQATAAQPVVAATGVAVRHGASAPGRAGKAPQLEAALACISAPASARPPPVPASERGTASQAASRERAAASALRRAAETQPRLPPVRNWAADAAAAHRAASS